MAEYSANALQTVPPGETVAFTTTEVPCDRGFVRNREGSGDFLLSGWVPNGRGGCCCNNQKSALYTVDFSANIAVPTGETVGAISVAVAINGTTIPTSTMIVTPAAVEEFFNVAVSKDIPIWNGCCQTVSIRNASEIPILVQNANITFRRPDLVVTY